MSKKILDLELACLFYENKKIEEFFEKDCDLKSICISFIKGDYYKTLTDCKVIKEILDIKSKSTPKEIKEQILENVNTYLKDSKESDQSEFLIMLIGIICLNLFVQNNYTGPYNKDLPQAPFEAPKDMESFVTSELSIQGETINNPTYSITYLYLSKLFLDRKEMKHLLTYPWWQGRCSLIHNKSLSYKVDTLLKQSQACFEQTELLIKDLDYRNGELKGNFQVEKGLMLMYYFQEIEAQECFKTAQKVTGLSMELSASLGVRTKFQQHQISQLVLFAESLGEDEEKGEAPKEVELEEDSILLAKPKLEKDSESKLRIIDQIILLAFCQNIKNSNAKHGLTTEEMFPYIRRVGQNSNNWLVHTEHLLIKSRLERESTKTVERSAIQFQVIGEQFYDETPLVNERIKFFYSLNFPSVYDLNKELGDRLMGVGALNSALQIFERLKMYEEMVQCLIAVDRSGKAEEIIKERLDVDKDDFKMIYLLGMVKDDPELYEQAWEKSGKRYARAKRALGNYYMKKKMYKECLPHYEAALAINHLYPLTWFSYGCACMFVSNFEKGANAFQKVLQQNPEDSDSWSNMGTCFIQLGKLNEAFKTLKEATKVKFDSWKIWENLLWISLQVEQFGDSFLALKRIIELNPLRVDAKYFNMLIKVMAYYLKDKDNDYGFKFRSKLNELLVEATNKLPGDARLWESYVAFYEESLFYNQEAKIVELILKQLRCLKREAWESSKDVFEAVAKTALKLWKYQAKLSESKENQEEKNQIKSTTQMEVNSILKAVKDHFPEHELYKQLQDLLDNFVWQ